MLLKIQCCFLKPLFNPSSFILPPGEKGYGLKETTLIEDLKFIHDYISKDSIAYANKFIEKLIMRVDQLENFPNSGKIVPEFGSTLIRELIEGSYRIVFKVNIDHIGIVRVHHSARELRNI